MLITKLGHCCLLVEENGLRILTDPGAYSSAQDSLKNIDVVLITHEHQGHFHIPSLETVLKNNPLAKVITNKAVGKLLMERNIAFSLIEHSGKTTIKDVLIEGCGQFHTPIHSSLPPVQNTGFFIAEEFFYPGDAFYIPKKKVRILALPVAGPWMKLSDAITYATEIKPDVCFPVHDGMLQEGRLGPVHSLPQSILPKKGIQFVILEEGKKKEF